MSSLQAWIRKIFLTGIFATAPIVMTIVVIIWINDKTQPITQWLFHRSIPLLGVVIALAAICLVGAIANSLMGKFILNRVDHLLARVPIIRPFYTGWKQIALTPGGTEGTFSKVVLIPDESGQMKYLGFTSGRLSDSAPPMYCVFVPSAPNPTAGRLYFVPAERCEILDMSPEEAFKVILSTGNYVPKLSLASPLSMLEK
ncbi:MAG TPA: DUF502 domain-containing protein [Tepidisphaeraceae bacterium]|nr:DUF502 domain-containing protein [Tepidisphaeraceae bacterium]